MLGGSECDPGLLLLTGSKWYPRLVSLLFLQLRNPMYLEMSDSGCIHMAWWMSESQPRLRMCLRCVPMVHKGMERCSTRSCLRRSVVGFVKVRRWSDAIRSALTKLLHLGESSRRCSGAFRPLWCNTLGHVGVSGLLSSSFLPQEL